MVLYRVSANRARVRKTDDLATRDRMIQGSLLFLVPFAQQVTLRGFSTLIITKVYFIDDLHIGIIMQI